MTGDPLGPVNGNWGRYSGFIEEKTNWRGQRRFRYVIHRRFAGITEIEARGLWRRDLERARKDGRRRLLSYERPTTRDYLEEL